MDLAGKSHSDGAFSKDESRGTIKDADWAKLQAHALKANRDRLVQRERLGRDNYHKRAEN